MTDARDARAYARLDCAGAADRLRGGVDTLILFHHHPDADAIGSAFGLRLLCEALGCRTLCAGADEIPERLRFLVGDAQISARYENLPADFAPEQILTVDTASPGQLNGNGEPPLYERLKGKIDLMIDHHGKGTPYADGWIDGGRAACGEMVFDLSRTLVRTGRLTSVPEGLDRLLYAAISGDTGCFKYSNVRPVTHRIAAELLNAGFDAAEINRLLFDVKSEKLLTAERLGADRLHLFAGGKIAVVDFPYALKKEYGLSDEHLETLVDIGRNLSGVEAAVAIRQPGEGGTYRASMRSNGKLDVSSVCASFGGGGHAKAAGCTITSEEGMDRVVEMVAGALERAMTP